MVPWLVRTARYLHPMASVMLTIAACGETHGPSDAATEVGPLLDAPAGGLDAPTDAGLDAPADDAPFLPLDAPFGREDTPPDDVPYVRIDGGGCVPGDYVLEDTPIARAPVALSYPSTDGWLELWRDATGTQVWHRIHGDLESIETLGPLADAPRVSDGITFEAAPTNAVDPAGRTLVLFTPVATSVPHLLGVVYTLGGGPVSAPTLVPVPSDAGPPRVAWTGDGYSIFVAPRFSPGAPMTPPPPLRIELDASGRLVSRTEGPPELTIAAPIYDEGTWRGIPHLSFVAVDAIISMAPDGTVSRGPAIGLSGQALLALGFSTIGGHFWTVGVSWFAGSPASLQRLSPAGPVVAWLDVSPTPNVAVALAVEDERTVGVLLSDASTVTFLRVRDDAVVQRLELPYASSPPGVLLRFVGGRYVVGWGPFLDELVLCP